MPDLAPTIDGYIAKHNQSTWAAARDATSGTANTSLNRHSGAVQAKKAAARGGGHVYSVYRSFFEFDTSGISVTPTDATLKIHGYNFGNADMFLVKANTATDGAIANADFDAIVGWSTGADNSSNVTKYSDEITTWNTVGVTVNNITLNAAALTSMVDDDVIKFCLIESTKDLTNTEPSDTTLNQSGLHFQEYTGTTYDPILSYTVGYGNSVMGVASGDISEVIDVATANISKVNGV